MTINPGVIAGCFAGVTLLGGSVMGVHTEIGEAHVRLEKGIVEAAKVPAPVAVADDAEAKYCTPKFKEVLQKVLFACGLVSSQRRGCEPADVQRLAAISDAEFNALFDPLKERGGVVMFDDGKEELDAEAKKLMDDLWVGRKGARYFFVVARASKTGTAKLNRALSHKRANSVKFYVEDKHNEKELDKLMGTLWLGFDFAQLGKEYCEWNVSRGGQNCNEEAINRSAFVSWVDCRL